MIALLAIPLLPALAGATPTDLGPPAPAPVQDRWRTLEDGGHPSLRYVLLLPKGFDGEGTFPTLLALPPGGQDEQMVETALGLYWEKEAAERGWVVVSPAAPAGSSFVSGAEDAIPALLDAVEKEVHVEGGRFHLAGVSNGGRAAFHLMALHPERFQSLTVLPGGPTSDVDRARLDVVAKVPVAMYVGALDTAWRDLARDTIERLEALGDKDVYLEEREGESHVVDAAVGTEVFDRLDHLRKRAAARARSGAEHFFDWTTMEFPPAVHAARRARLAERLKAQGGGVFLAPSAEGVSEGETFRQRDDFLYLTGLELPSTVVAIDADSGKTTLFTPDQDARFESESRPNDFPGRPLAGDPALATLSGVDAVQSIQTFDAALAGWAQAGRKLWVDPGAHGLIVPGPPALFGLVDEEGALERTVRALFPAMKVADAHEEIARLRMIKGPEEVDRIRKACAITADAMRDAARAVRPGVDERTLTGILEAGFARGGAQRPAFDSIIKSGPNSLWPWRILAAQYDRRNRAMQAGELVIFDVGCELDHYASDVGRTFPVSGKFTADQAAKLAMVTAASDAIFAAVRPGVTFAELKDVALKSLPEDERTHSQTGTYFGHHIGLDVGDPSVFDAPLEPGMVFTIEPWYYDHEDGIAVFIEDDVLVTADGAERLTDDLPRKPEELEKMMGRE